MPDDRKFPFRPESYGRLDDVEVAIVAPPAVPHTKFRVTDFDEPTDANRPIAAVREFCAEQFPDHVIAAVVATCVRGGCWNVTVLYEPHPMAVPMSTDDIARFYGIPPEMVQPGHSTFELLLKSSFWGFDPVAT